MAKDKKPKKDVRYGTLWEPVDLTPEQIAKACMQGPPKLQFDYLKPRDKKPQAE